jgi:ubiquinone/menaquinone biosynthesis C-methylase UbiE
MNIKQANADRKVRLLSPYITKNMRVLDFGCGDLALANNLFLKRPDLQIGGIDVIDFGVNVPGIPFRTYDGKRIPFNNDSFDVVVAWHVFHHTDQPSRLFRECMRVAKKRVLFVEPVYRSVLELPGMALMDWVFNIWKTKSVSMHYAFRSRRWWEEHIAREHGMLRNVIDVEILPRWLPTGRSLLFVVDKPS